MKKKKISILILLIVFIIPFIVSCGGQVREALEGKKRSEQSDEFLVKKKNPLQMPPDMYKLPTPGDNIEKIVESKNSDNDVKELLKIKDGNTNKDDNTGSDLLNNMKKKIQ
ncbi:DUF3035 domain-containing protein [Candidatus Pelagibacter sp.]|nr:DUF3035 domain-containing protein [Candidatus Pelagibacter sp.]|tara:strand:+ start:118 stop:450 length:333 start_codon:yes stop_codon:yes gene_type:complete